MINAMGIQGTGVIDQLAGVFLFDIVSRYLLWCEAQRPRRNFWCIRNCRDKERFRSRMHVKGQTVLSSTGQCRWAGIGHLYPPFCC